MRVGTARYRHACRELNDNGEDDEEEIEELCKRVDLDPDMSPWEWVTAVMERMWQDEIIWRHMLYTVDHEMFLPLKIDLEDSYQTWKRSAVQMRRRKAVFAEYPYLALLSCDEGALQASGCDTCSRPQFGFRNWSDVRWLFSNE